MTANGGHGNHGGHDHDHGHGGHDHDHGHGGHDHDHGHGVNSVPRRWAKRILVIFFSLCGVLAALDVVALVWHIRYEEHPWEAMPVFYPVWGFAGIALLILLSKGLRRLVMRSEDYYDAE